MSVDIIAVDAGIRDEEIPAAVESISVVDRAHLQGGGNRNRLEHRTRLITFRYAEILPHGIQGVHILFVIHGLYFRPGIVGGQVVWIIQVIFPVGSHGKHGPAVGIHHDDADIPRAFSVVELISVRSVKLVDLFLDNLLHIHVQCETEGLPVLRLHRCALEFRIFIQVTELSSVGPVQDVIVIILHARHADVDRVRKADNLAGKGTVRIGADIFLLKPDPFYIVSLLLFFLIGIRAHGLGIQIFSAAVILEGSLRLRRHVAQDNLVAGVFRLLIHDPVPYHGRIQSQDFLRRLNRGFAEILIRIDDVAVQNDIIKAVAPGQNDPVGILDLSSSGGNRPGVVALLREHLLRVFVPSGRGYGRDPHQKKNQ